MRIGCAVAENNKRTGPRTYRSAIERVMTGAHEFKFMQAPADEQVDLYHILDVKRVNYSDWRGTDRPVIIDIHDHYWHGFEAFPCPDLPVRWLLQKLRAPHYRSWIDIADAVIVHSHAVAECIDHDSLHVVPYGIDPSEFDAPAEVIREPILLLPGRDCFRKGLPVALSALRKLRSEIPQIRLMVIGDEFAHTRLAAKVISTGLPVSLLPGVPRSELINWYHKATALVLPSYTEAFGIVLIEAMAAGLPVVAAGVGGIPEAVEHEANGLLFNKGDATGLSEQVLRLFNDDELRQRLVDSGRQSLAGMHDLSTMAGKLEQVYRSVK